jgi:transglutaminase-like putative cysteine protease
VLYSSLDIHPFIPLSSFTMDKYLRSTKIIDWETESVKNKARELTRGLNTPREKALALYYFVGDEIKQNPYAPGFVPEDYKATPTTSPGTKRVD